MKRLLCSLFLFSATAFADPLELTVDFSKPDGAWDMPALAPGQGGLQGDPMIAPHIKELKQLRPRTVRLFLSEYYRIYPAHGVYDFTKLDRELEAAVATGARPTLAVAMKPPVLFPVVDHFKVQKLDMAAYYQSNDPQNCSGESTELAETVHHLATSAGRTPRGMDYRYDTDGSCPNPILMPPAVAAALDASGLCAGGAIAGGPFDTIFRNALHPLPWGEEAEGGS